MTRYKTAFHLRQNYTLLLRAQGFFNLKYIFSHQRWNRTTPTLIGYGFEARTPGPPVIINANLTCTITAYKFRLYIG